MATAKRKKIAFPVLSDKDNVVARQFGFVFSLSSDVDYRTRIEPEELLQA